MCFPVIYKLCLSGTIRAIYIFSELESILFSKDNFDLISFFILTKRWLPFEVYLTIFPVINYLMNNTKNQF